MDQDIPITPEEDKFIHEAVAEFNLKQGALYRDWRILTTKDWRFDQADGLLKLDLEDGARFLADGQVVGTYAPSQGSWEWAWGSPLVKPELARDSLLVKELGARLGIPYLHASPVIPVPNEDTLRLLAAICIKATDSIGIYRADLDNLGRIDMYILLKSPRWAWEAT
jgi:hypothetical protein